MKIVGLTGGIACGKSTVAEDLKRRGYPVIDTDEIAHEFFHPSSEFAQKLLSWFGILDRKAIRKRVFENPQEKEKLEKFLHPEIWKRVDQEIFRLQNKIPKPRLVFVVVPLLFETQTQERFDFSLAVLCKTETQLQRLMGRDSISKKLALQMIRSQLSNEEKQKQATFVLWNDSHPEALLRKIPKLLEELRKY